MAGNRRASRSSEGDHEKVRTAWRLVACVPLVLLVGGLGVRAGLEADWNDDTRPTSSASDNRGGNGGEKSSPNTQRVGTKNVTLRREFAGQGKLTAREARARCEKSGIDPADLGSMSECIADLTK